MENKIKGNLFIKDSNHIEDSIEDKIIWGLFEKEDFSIVDTSKYEPELNKLKFNIIIYSSISVYIELKNEIISDVKYAFLGLNDNLEEMDSGIIKNLDLIYTQLLPTEIYNINNSICIEDLKKFRLFPTINSVSQKTHIDNKNIIYIYNKSEKENILLKRVLNNVDESYLKLIDYKSDFSHVFELLKNSNFGKIILDNVPLEFYYKIKLLLGNSIEIKFANTLSIPSIERLLFKDSTEVYYAYNNYNKFNKFSIREYLDFIFFNSPKFNNFDQLSSKNDTLIQINTLQDIYSDYLNFVFDQQNLNHRNATKYLFRNTKIKHYLLGYFYLIKRTKKRNPNEISLLFNFTLKHFCTHYPPMGYLYCISILKIDPILFLHCLFDYKRSSSSTENLKLKYLSTQILISHSSAHKNINKISSKLNAIPSCSLISKILVEEKCNNFDLLFKGFSKDDLEYTIFRMIENHKLEKYFSLRELLNYLVKESSDFDSILSRLNIISLGIIIHNNDFHFIEKFSNCFHQKKILEFCPHFVNILLHQISKGVKFSDQFINSVTKFFDNNNTQNFISLLCLSLSSNNFHFLNSYYLNFTIDNLKCFYEEEVIYPYYKYLYIEIICNCFLKNKDLSVFSQIRSHIDNEIYIQHESMLDNLNSIDFSSLSFYNHFNRILERFFNN